MVNKSKKSKFSFVKKILGKSAFSRSIYYSSTNISKRLQYEYEWRIFKKMQSKKRGLAILSSDKQPALHDRTKTTQFDTHYIYHPAWAARILKKINPNEHIDIASTLAFSSIISAFIPIKFYDLRPAHLNLSGLESTSANITKLPMADNSVVSLSCMHTIEHIGLGRYGDALDPDGDLKAILELRRIVKPGGSLLFVVPITGRSRVCFNAHRIYSYEQILSYFPDFSLKEFSLIPDDALESGMIYNATTKDANKQNYGCGCFWFVKN